MHQNLKLYDEGTFISIYLDLWEKYKTYLRWYKKIFLYLDHYFLKNQGTTIINEGFKILKEEVINVYRDRLF